MSSRVETRELGPGPDVGEAVVLAGSKYRIRELRDGIADLAAAGPAWRRTPILEAVAIARLAWDHRAGLWRLDPGEPARGHGRRLFRVAGEIAVLLALVGAIALAGSGRVSADDSRVEIEARPTSSPRLLIYPRATAPAALPSRPAPSLPDTDR